MPLNSKLTAQTAPARDRFKREITLLSHGYSCPEAFPEGKIMVYPWTNKIDEYLTSPKSRKARKDNTTFDLVTMLAGLNGCPIGQFVMGEVMLVLLVARSISRQNRLPVDLECPACGHAMHQDLNVPDDLERLGEKGPDYEGFDLVTLPDSKEEVALRPLLIQDELDIQKREYRDITETMARVLTAVVSVGGGKPDNILEVRHWYDCLSPADSEFLYAQQIALTPHLSLVLHCECDECGEKFDHVLRIDADFFRSSR